MAVKDRNLYLSWLTMTQKEREELYVEAEHNKASRSLFRKMYTSVKVETNKRMRELKAHDYDYGKQYNNLVRYLNIEQDSNIVPSMTKLKNDIDQMMTVMEQASKFLKSKYSKWQNRLLVEQRQMQFFEDHKERFGDIMGGWKYKEKRAFLRWLHNEEVSFALDEYGTSDETIVILADAYHEAGKQTNGYETLNKAMLEWAGGQITFDDAMKSVGVSIEDRHNERKQNWHYEKRNMYSYRR